MTRIHHAVARLSGMLVDLRDFTRTRLGALVGVDREACDIRMVVRDIADELRPVYPDRHIAVECSGDLVARVDARRIAQLVSNLVANALQHGSATTNVTVGAHGDADTVTIDVQNMGRAIDPALMKTLFDPLSRQSGDADNERLGLGLYIAQQIALAHDGSIDVSSTRDAGTRFTVRLPRQPASKTTA